MTGGKIDLSALAASAIKVLRPSERTIGAIPASVRPLGDRSGWFGVLPSFRAIVVTTERIVIVTRSHGRPQRVGRVVREHALSPTVEGDFSLHGEFHVSSLGRTLWIASAHVPTLSGYLALATQPATSPPDRA